MQTCAAHAQDVSLTAHPAIHTRKRAHTQTRAGVGTQLGHLSVELGGGRVGSGEAAGRVTARRHSRELQHTALARTLR